LAAHHRAPSRLASRYAAPLPAILEGTSTPAVCLRIWSSSRTGGRPWSFWRRSQTPAKRRHTS